jgi:hypothetical protein
MSRQLEEIDEELADRIAAQRVFFAATAPAAAESKGRMAMAGYRVRKNALFIDGLPACG